MDSRYKYMIIPKEETITQWCQSTIEKDHKGVFIGPYLDRKAPKTLDFKITMGNTSRKAVKL